MRLVIFLGVFFLTASVRASAPRVDAVTPAVALENTTAVAVRVTGVFLNETTNITVGNLLCEGPYEINVTGCRINITRQDACAAGGADFGIPGSELEECDAEADCEWAESTSIGCAPPSPAETCVRQRCRYALDGQCYSFPTTPDGFPCAPGMACVAGLCVDARADHCVTTVGCTLPATPGVGVHDVVLTTANGSTSSLPAAVRILPQPGAVWVSGETFSPTSPIAGGVTSWTDGGEYNHTVSLLIEGFEIEPGDPFPPLATNPGEPVRTVAVGFAVWFRDFAAEPLVTQVFAPTKLAQRPTIYSLCPSAVLAFVANTIVVQGEDFAPFASCLLDGARVFTNVLNDRTVACTVALEANASTPTHEIQVTNDNTTNAPAPGTVTVIGDCASLKPNSMPVGAECLCGPGFRDTGAACIPCADGSYQPGTGQGACLPCDSTENTGGSQGSTSAAACQCKDGRFRPDELASSCDLCAAGMICENGTVAAAPGYWRPSNASLFVIECPGGDVGCAGGAGAGDASCRKGHEGPLCSVCADGFAEIGNTCVKCGSEAVSGLVVAASVVGACAVACVVIRSNVNPNQTTVNFGVIIKIAMNYFQMLYVVGSLAADWGALGDSFFASTAVAALSPLFYLRCATTASFATRMYLTMALPVLAAVATALPYLLMFAGRKAVIATYPRVQGWDSETILKEFCAAVLIVEYLILPGIALEVSAVFRCETVRGLPGSYVRADRSVSCNTSEYATLYGATWGFCIFYVMGAIAFVAYKVYKNRAALELMSMTISARASPLSYIVRGYNPRHMMWEGAVLARKLAVVLTSAFVSDAYQLLCANIVIGLSLEATRKYTPFAGVWANSLECRTLAALWVTTLIGLWAQLGGSAHGVGVFVLVVGFNLVAAFFLFSETARNLKGPAAEFVARLAACFSADEDSDVSNIVMRRKSTTAVVSWDDDVFNNMS